MPSLLNNVFLIPLEHDWKLYIKYTSKLHRNVVAWAGEGGGSVSYIAVNDLTFENAIYHKITFIIFDSI